MRSSNRGCDRPEHTIRLVLVLLTLLGAAPAPCAGAQLVKAGSEGFRVADLAAWQGRVVRRIDVRGHQVTRETVIRREIRTEVGEPLVLETVAADVTRLDNISIFAQIDVDAEAAGDDGVRLTFVFKEMPSWIPLVSFVYTEENGFSAGPGVTALNVDGRGIRFSGRAYFGGTRQYWVRVQDPWVAGNHLGFDVFGARYERTDALRGFEETSEELTPELGTWLGDRGRLRGKLSLFRMRSDTDGVTLSPDNDDLLVRLGVAVGWDSRDSWRNPTRGWQNELEVWKTGGFLGGDGDFWSMNLDLRRWFRTGHRQKLQLAGLLSLQSGDLGADVPLYMDYRLGGANTIRGYSVNELGKALAGKNQLLGTAEYSFTLVPLRRWDIWVLSMRLGIELAVFGDVGTAWSEPAELGWSRTRAGAGAGLRILVPGTEMTRFDVGWSPEGGVHFHFGNWSRPAAQRFRLR